MSLVFRKTEYYYILGDGKTTSNNLSSVESFSARTNDKDYVGVYIHTNDGKSGAFHLLEVNGVEQIHEVATFQFERYDETSLVKLEETCAKYTDSTFRLKRVSDTLDIFMDFLEKGC